MLPYSCVHNHHHHGLIQLELCAFTKMFDQNEVFEIVIVYDCMCCFKKAPFFTVYRMSIFFYKKKHNISICMLLSLRTQGSKYMKCRAEQCIRRIPIPITLIHKRCFSMQTLQLVSFKMLFAITCMCVYFNIKNIMLSNRIDTDLMLLLCLLIMKIDPVFAT